MFKILTPCLLNLNQARYAARKGIRIQRAREARLRAAKRRLLEAQNPKVKKNYKASSNLDKYTLSLFNDYSRELELPESPPDDVFYSSNYRRRKLSIDECIEIHRQACHPDLLNQPRSFIQASILLNLKMKIKKKKIIESIESTVCYPNLFSYQLRQRKIVALVKDELIQAKAKEAGAFISGGLEVVQQLKTKQLTERDFDHIVAHTDIIVDFANVKGMKAASFFPSKQRGNFGEDLPYLVTYFKNGLDYSLKKKPDTKEYGFITALFGTTDMSSEQLISNLLTFFKSVNRFKPVNIDDGKQFFQQVIIGSPDNNERLICKFWEVFDEYIDPDNISIEEMRDNSVNTKRIRQ